MKKLKVLLSVCTLTLSSYALGMTPKERWQKASSLKELGILPSVVSCSTYPLTTTTYFRQNSEGEFDLGIFHHNGEKWGPIHKGVITTNDLPTLEAKALKLLKLGENYQVKYKANECRSLGPNEFVCYHQFEDFEYLGELRVKGHSFHVSTASAVSFGHTFNTYETRFSVTTNDGLPYTTSFDVVMDYDQSLCLYQ